MRIISAERLSATQRHLGLIVAAWLAYLAVLGSLQLLGYKSGFAVWPLGEDRNWISILLKGEGANAAGVFWQVNDRNPLSPWWYIAFRKLILDVEPGLLILRLLVGLSLGIASYVLIAAVTQTRILALGVGLTVTLWMANGYVDQIYWNFQAALVCSLVSVIFYHRFLQSGRADHRLYALSLVMWLLAIGTYTIQCGAMLAIAYLALRHEGAAAARDSFWTRVKLALFDATPYLLLFIFFLLIWRTAARTPETYALGFDVLRFITSLKQGLWHSDNSLFAIALWNAPHYLTLILLAAVAGIGIALLMRKEIERRPEPFRAAAALDIIVISLCLVAPTVAVEGLGSTWIPGEIWRKCYQFSTPALALCALFALLAWLGKGIARPAWAAVTGAFCAIAVLSSLSVIGLI